jgi:hypothetical protein
MAKFVLSSIKDIVVFWTGGFHTEKLWLCRLLQVIKCSSNCSWTLTWPKIAKVSAHIPSHIRNEKDFSVKQCGSSGSSSFRHGQCRFCQSKSSKEVKQLREKVRNNQVKRIHNKTKTIAWMVSHCDTHGQREAYIKELVKFIDVDVCGPCGTLSCPRHDFT